MPVLGYLTVHPVSVVEPTMEWLQENGFPNVPVIAKPNKVPFSDGNQWKGAVNELIPCGITGIVDNNTKVSIHAGKDYHGTLFLFGRASCPKGTEHALPCATWKDVVNGARSRRESLMKQCE